MPVPLDSLFQNLQTVLKNSNLPVESIGIDHEFGALKNNSKTEQLFLRLKHLFGGRGAYINKVSEVLRETASSLEEMPRYFFVDEESNTFTRGYEVVEWFNQLVTHPEKSDLSLFKELKYQSPIVPISCPECTPALLERASIQITHEKGIPTDQYPLVKYKGDRLSYYYNEQDVHHNPFKEGFRIFSCTQGERFKSFLGRLGESILRILGKKKAVFQEAHFFSEKENEKAGIYAQDAPLALNPTATTYWIGHATCLLNLPVQDSSKETFFVHLLTDPIEGDLNKWFYPRYTSPSRTIEQVPFPHIVFLTHNHLDHFDRRTLRVLKKFQPLTLVAKGDGKKVRQLGFKNVIELNWWDKIKIPIKKGPLKGALELTIVPANHWSGQSLFATHDASFLGFIIHQPDHDIYFAGDTARLSSPHLNTLRTRYNITSTFQPAGPDEIRNDLKSAHQASVDGLWMHFTLMVENLYQQKKFQNKAQFIAEAKTLRTIFIHLKTFKLGNIHFNDAEVSVGRVKKTLLTGQPPHDIKDYEFQVVSELRDIGKKLVFNEGSLTDHDILELIQIGVFVPQIGSRTALN